MIPVPLLLIAFVVLASFTFGLVGWLCLSRGGFVVRFMGQLAACVAVMMLLLAWLMYTERVSIKVTFPHPSCPEGLMATASAPASWKYGFIADRGWAV